jgi:CubicO group peptidase (beta-lactamase class C family)
VLDPFHHPLIGLPSGGSFANAADLLRFTAALLGNRLLSRQHTELLLSPKLPRPPLPGAPPRVDFETYAPSAILFNGQWVVGHNGGTAGVSTNLEWYPDLGWVAVTLSNYDPPATQPIDMKARQLITQR